MSMDVFAEAINCLQAWNVERCEGGPDANVMFSGILSTSVIL